MLQAWALARHVLVWIMLSQPLHAARHRPDLSACACLPHQRPGTWFNVFWHIGIMAERKAAAERILSRQFATLNTSGVLRRSTVHIGVVGNISAGTPDPALPTLTAIVQHPHVRLVAAAPRGRECVTTAALRRFAVDTTRCCEAQPCCQDRVLPVLYMHSKGSRAPSPGSPMELWAIMMEYFLIMHWRTSAYLLTRLRALTTGCEMWQAAFRLPYSSKKTYHYSGNFWWATVAYLGTLPDPVEVSQNGKNKFLCGEAWLLMRYKRGRHAVLHSTDQWGQQGRISSYGDLYPRHMYDCPIAVPQPHLLRVVPSPIPCYPIKNCTGPKCKVEVPQCHAKDCISEQDRQTYPNASSLPMALLFPPKRGIKSKSRQNQ